MENGRAIFRRPYGAIVASTRSMNDLAASGEVSCKTRVDVTPQAAGN
jgi:hypothetical protein